MNMNQNENNESTSGNNNSNNGGNRRSRVGNSGRAVDSGFVGTTPEIRGVLCLPVETNVKARVGYNKFRDLLKTYIAKHFKDAAKIASAVETLKNPVSVFDKIHTPKNPAKQPKPGSVEELILKEEAKELVSRRRAV